MTVYVTNETGADKTYTVPLQTGEGVGLLEGKIAPEIMARIERLGRMNDERLKLLGIGDRQRLLRLADSYEHLGTYGCPRLAEEIRQEAEDIGRQNKGKVVKVKEI